MFSTKSPDEVVRSFSPEKDRASPLAAWRWRRGSVCTANTWLIKRSRAAFNAAVGSTLGASGADVCDGWVDHTGIIIWGGSGCSLPEWCHSHSRAAVMRDEKSFRGIRTSPFGMGWDTGSVAVSPLGALQSRIS